MRDSAGVYHRAADVINQLLFHHDWLVGAGGGSDNGFLAFWKTDKVPEAPPKDKKDALAAQRIKGDGHIHKFALNAAGTELYAAGYRKLEIWSLGV